ncbi:DNA replication/repair protein RecF [Beijerinckia indica]|uniref:DNA replication and repair protein RecF n=1 Tax=Beijerinckia indica subsp. indica (strain ATCC 9039 / DSM 1715 / NCIMB 8712) TaxID=395963 RepID=B2ICB0_BEII9|nr:DNA replication/repair protein RecF [Beijerinckia indica]ACB96707.1 DNA replication and repair protein RecF [Beijerinckia indica subsp. indica ATCC 9039]
MSEHCDATGLAIPLVRRLILSDFRSYPALDLSLGAKMIVVTGENGAGKTNLIEALSLFTPGRGLRRVELASCARAEGPGGFAVSIEIETGAERVQLGTGLVPRSEGGFARQYRIERAPVGSARSFADHLRIVWLTPAQDGLFAASPGERRRFLDRLVLCVDAEHGARVTVLERALRNRNRQLEDHYADSRWLDATEKEIAEIAVAVAAARVETVARLRRLIDESRDTITPFPWADLEIRGDLERLVGERPALEAEELYRGILRDNRRRDAAAGRALVGPQNSDLLVRHGPKQADAARSSTGEQKALLVGLVLAHARLVARATQTAPMILLDEIAAHFDASRRVALYEELAALPGQIWMTGAEASAFSGLADHADLLQVRPGLVGRLAHQSDRILPASDSTSDV